MNRWRRAVRLLACGAGCSVLSAIIPLVVEPYLPESESQPASPAVRLPLTPSEFPDPSVLWVKRRIGLLHETAISGIGIEDSWHAERLSAGWPFRMLEGGDSYEFHNTGGKAATAEMHPVALYAWRSGKRLWRIPLRPRPWDASGNFVFWTLTCSAAAWGLPAVRRRRRRAAGMCETCGYPAADAGPCPECGARRA
jgi:hypothetical protein